MLQSMGLENGTPPELWNISEPEKVIAAHKAYFDAGSNIVSTNTFGVNALKYDDETLERLIVSAVNNCRTAKDSSEGTQQKFIAFDIGPTGKLLKPLGDLGFDDAVEIFSKSVRIAAKANVDLIIIETFNDSYETKAALLAVKENCDLPVFVTNAYGEDGKLLTGATPAIMAGLLESMGAVAVGANCSFGPEQTAKIVSEISKHTNLPVVMKPNAGLPQYIDGKTVYNVTPKDFALEVAASLNSGVSIVGGCCGTTPEHIRELSREMASHNLKKRDSVDETAVSSYCKNVIFTDSPILIGERINPTGKKRFKQALLENDIDYIISEGINQTEKGVHILDVNVGLAGINEAQMLRRTVTQLQAVTELPLQLDSADPVALEGAMRIYNGKPLVNSVNGKAESMSQIFPLIKKYGGAVIALTLDEAGIPETVDGRISIARKILNEAAKYGIRKRDIIFDPLVMAVSTNSNNAAITLECVNRISRELGCRTSLGISNVSFGLPERDMLNSSFLLLAMQNGLSAAIINPQSRAIMDTYYSFCALSGMDIGFENYISHCSDKAGISSEQICPSKETDLLDAITRGRKERAAVLTEKLLHEAEGLTIINEYIIPALDKTGQDFEKGILYLPQLLMSAEAASAAFDCIRKHSEVSKERKNKIILASVKGDVHDIGKNIVRLLLENYGYDVIDLGKDVPASRIVGAVQENNVKLVGLSALMTTTLDAMRETVILIKNSFPDCRVFVGGAVVTAEFADSIGADAYTKDALESVRFAERVFNS